MKQLEKIKENKEKILDSIINVMIVVSVIGTFLGLTIAIWVGLIGLQIAGTGVTIFGMAFTINWLSHLREVNANDKMQERKRW